MICPSPDKRAYVSEAQAKRGLRGIRNPQGQMYAYRCGGHWHIGHGYRNRETPSTSTPQRRKKARR